MALEPVYSLAAVVTQSANCVSRRHRHPDVLIGGGDANGWSGSREQILIEMSGHRQVSHFSGGELREPDAAVNASDETIGTRSPRRQRKCLDPAAHRHLVNSIRRILCDVKPAVAAFGNS